MIPDFPNLGDASTWMNFKDINDNNAFRYKTIQWNNYSQRNNRARKCLLIVLIFLTLFLIYINTYTVEQTYPDSQTDFEVHDVQNSSLRFTSKPTTDFIISTNGCRIPDFDPLDIEVIEYFIRKDETIICDSSYLPRLIATNETAVYINHTSKNQYYNNEEMECCWTSILRKEGDDNGYVYGKTCHEFDESALVDSDFVSVICWKKRKSWLIFTFGKKEVVYRDFFTFVPRKEIVEKRCNEKTSKAKNATLSVLIVGLDSVSRVNLHRQMPKTVQALRDLGAIEMLGYNKIAYNTYPNLITILTGMSEEEIQTNCWKQPNDYFDDCHFLWNDFSEFGYRTILGEDACGMSIFNFLKPGFIKPPTDYYLRPYCLAIENNIGNTYKSNAHLCVGGELNFVNLLDYTRKVSVTFKDDPYFALFWQSSLTHDYFDYPRFGDDKYSEFLANAGKNLLNKTALVFMSDHGMRWGDFRQTFQGKLEENLPFMFISLPDWWKAKYPAAAENLQQNTLSLTTPFDLHETLLDILKIARLDENVLKNREKLLGNSNMPRGISWFSPIPSSRNCELAVIPDHFCSCRKSRSISLNDSIVDKNAKFLVDELNRMIGNFPQCATLKLKSIVDAKVSVDDDSKMDDGIEWEDYTITLETVPGSAIFEGTVRRWLLKGNLGIVGPVSRLTSYRDQSACIDDFNMRLYCYCR